MQPREIIMLVLGILLGIFLIALIVLSVKLSKLNKQAAAEEQHADKVKIVKGVRYSTDDAIADKEGMEITHTPGDFILKSGETYRAGKGEDLLPGVYTALSANGGDRNFKLRIGGLVRNLVHGDEVVLGEGDEICAVSATVVLR